VIFSSRTRSEKDFGVVFRVMVLMFCLSVFQLLSLTTSWYLPFMPVTNMGTNLYPSISKLTGRRIPDFSPLADSFTAAVTGNQPR
jgi:hypothetical protein